MNLRKLATRRLAGALGLLLALSLVLVPTSVLAVPQSGHIFYGTVTDEGGAAAEGTVITARVDGLEYTAAGVAVGEYGYRPAPEFNIPADDPDTSEVEGAEAGDLIEFYIGDIKAELYDVDADESLDSYPFEIMGKTKLNLSVGEAPPPSLTADAGGPYSGTVGEEITLLGSASGGTSPYTYAWDLDGDEVYDDSDAQNPSYTWDTAGSYTIGLQVTDSAAATDTDTATVTVTEEGAVDPWDYDEDENEVIDKDETLAAVNDYLGGTITKEQALLVVKLYFS